MTFTISHDHVGISVTPEDLDATILWYTDVLGLAVEKRFETHGFTFVFLARGTVRIELSSVSPPPRRSPATRSGRPGSWRHTPGLRRDEVARPAGMSIDYSTAE